MQKELVRIVAPKRHGQDQLQVEDLARQRVASGEGPVAEVGEEILAECAKEPHQDRTLDMEVLRAVPTEGVEEGKVESAGSPAVKESTKNLAMAAQRSDGNAAVLKTFEGNALDDAVRAIGSCEW